MKSLLKLSVSLLAITALVPVANAKGKKQTSTYSHGKQVYVQSSHNHNLVRVVTGYCRAGRPIYGYVNRHHRAKPVRYSKSCSYGKIVPLTKYGTAVTVAPKRPLISIKF